MSSSTIKVDLIRHYFDPDSPDRGIMGHLYINGVYVCDTLEPCEKTKYGCVEAGVYSVYYGYSPSFRKKMWYLDMKKAGSRRTGIMFHVGNSSEDTKGCILLGYITNPKSFYLTGSKIAYNIFESNIKNTFVLGISDVYKVCE